MGIGFDPDILYTYMNIKHKFTCFLVLFVCLENSLMPASHVALKIAPTTLLSDLGLKLSPSPTSLLTLIWCWRGAWAGCEQAALPGSSGVSCLTAVPEPFTFSETELGGYYYSLCLLKEVNLSFIHNLMRRFLFMFCQSQAVP